MRISDWSSDVCSSDLIQLRRMADWHATRLRYAQKIWHAASKLSALRVPVLPDGIEHAAYKCYVFLRPSMLVPAWSHERIMQAIAAQGVPVYSGSCSEVYLEKAFRSEEHTSELQSLMRISYAVFCLKKKN